MAVYIELSWYQQRGDKNWKSRFTCGSGDICWSTSTIIIKYSPHT